MKNIYSLLLLASFVFCLTPTITLKAQTASIIKIGHVVVKNDGNTDINMQVERTINSIDSAFGESYFCFGLNCFPPSTSISPGTDVIPACDIDQSFTGDYKIKDSSIFNDTSSVTYCFYDVTDPTNAQCITLLFSGNSPENTYLSDTLVFGSGCIAMSNGGGLFSGTSVNVFPNPASNWINVSYSLGNKDKDAWFVLRNMLGATKVKMKLHGSSGKIKIPASDLNQGVYFYSLLVDDNVYETKKLIVDN